MLDIENTSDTVPSIVTFSAQTNKVELIEPVVSIFKFCASAKTFPEILPLIVRSWAITKTFPSTG